MAKSEYKIVLTCTKSGDAIDC